VLEAQWVELERIFSNASLVSDLDSHRVLLLCYDGNTARVATSVLRAKGLEAESIRGGCQVLRSYGIGDDIVPASNKVPYQTTVSVSAMPLD
jgi:cysteine synthase A